MVGDAVGLPQEGVRPALIKSPDKRSIIGGWRMVSDDTEHSLITLLCVRDALTSSDPVKTFKIVLRKRLGDWILAMPASAGTATIKACLRSAAGMRSTASISPGNGPLMRVPAIAALVADPALRRQFTIISTAARHAGYSTVDYALAGMEAIVASSQGMSTAQWVAEWNLNHWNERNIINDNLSALAKSIARGEAASVYARSIIQKPERGIPGTSFATLMIALKCWSLHENDFEGAIGEAIRLGGDTDTVAALTGALVGARVGKGGIPKKWLGTIQDVYSPTLLEEAANGVNTVQMPGCGTRAARNAMQLAVFLTHAFTVRPLY